MTQSTLEERFEKLIAIHWNEPEWEFERQASLSKFMTKILKIIRDDFIPNELSRERNEVLEEILKDLEGEMFVNPSEAGQFALHADGYNQGIEDSQHIIRKKILALKKE